MKYVDASGHPNDPGRAGPRRPGGTGPCPRAPAGDAVRGAGEAPAQPVRIWAGVRRLATESAPCGAFRPECVDPDFCPPDRRCLRWPRPTVDADAVGPPARSRRVRGTPFGGSVRTDGSPVMAGWLRGEVLDVLEVRAPKREPGEQATQRIPVTRRESGSASAHRMRRRAHRCGVRRPPRARHGPRPWAAVPGTSEEPIHHPTSRQHRRCTGGTP